MSWLNDLSKDYVDAIKNAPKRYQDTIKYQEQKRKITENEYNNMKNIEEIKKEIEEEMNKKIQKMHDQIMIEIEEKYKKLD